MLITEERRVTRLGRAGLRHLRIVVPGYLLLRPPGASHLASHRLSPLPCIEISDRTVTHGDHARLRNTITRAVRPTRAGVPATGCSDEGGTRGVRGGRPRSPERGEPAAGGEGTRFLRREPRQFWRASLTCSNESVRGHPPTRPLALAAANPSSDASRSCSRWSCAAAPRTAKTIRPPGVVVSMDSVRLFSPTPMVCKRSDKASRSRRFLESREREYTPRHLPAGGVRAWRRGLSARPLHL
jgi:hypothetical protein